jgi:hypothetical protein
MNSHFAFELTFFGLWIGHGAEKVAGRTSVSRTFTPPVYLTYIMNISLTKPPLDSLSLRQNYEEKGLFEANFG